jgi:hypothetical protein
MKIIQVSTTYLEQQIRCPLVNFADLLFRHFPRSISICCENFHVGLNFLLCSSALYGIRILTKPEYHASSHPV